MDKKTNNKNLLIVFLIIVIIFGIWYLKAEKQSYEITMGRLKNIQSQVEQEKQKKQEYKIQAEKLNTDLEALNNDLEAAKSQLKRLKILETDNTNLLRIKQGLEQKTANLEKEKQLIEAKLHSLQELKKLVRQAKIEISGQKTQQHIAKKRRQEDLDAQKTAKGNRGFIIRGSKSTYKPTIKISVKPVN